MNHLNYARVLKPEDLVSKSDSELLQLKRYYEIKVQESEKYDIFKKPKEWIINHRNKAILMFLAGVVIMVVSFYLGVKNNSFTYSIPAMIVMAVIMFFVMMLEDKKSDTYRKNYIIVNLLLKVRIESNNNKTPRPTISKKAMLVYETLKELKESNLTVLRKKLKEKGIEVTEKTLRKYLKEDLKDVVGLMNSSFDSISRHQKEAKVYYIK